MNHEVGIEDLSDVCSVRKDITACLQRLCMLRHTSLPGGSGHVHGVTPEGVDQDAVLVSGRYELAHVKVTFSDTRCEGVKGLAVHLECGRPKRRGPEYAKTLFNMGTPTKKNAGTQRNIIHGMYPKLCANISSPSCTIRWEQQVNHSPIDKLEYWVPECFLHGGMTEECHIFPSLCSHGVCDRHIPNETGMIFSLDTRNTSNTTDVERDGPYVSHSARYEFTA